MKVELRLEQIEVVQMSSGSFLRIWPWIVNQSAIRLGVVWRTRQVPQASSAPSRFDPRMTEKNTSTRREVDLSLTAPERETVITFSDEDGTARIHTHQRRIITKLRNNPAAMQLEDLSFDGTAGAAFEIPADLISFRSRRRKLGPEAARAAAANLHREPV